MNKFKIQKNQGYAIMFTVVVVSVIMVIAIGMSNIVYKELMLASVANDSQTAFYQADTASECGLYADLMGNLVNGDTFYCGKDNSDNTYAFTVDTATDHLVLTPDENSLANSPCFNVNILKDTALDPVVSNMTVKGYSKCDFTNKRTVERKIQVSY